MHSPKIKVHGLAHKGISLLCMLFGEDFEVASLPGNTIMLGTNGRTCQGSSDIKVVHTALAVPKGRV